MRCELTCRIVSLAKHKATIKNTVLRIILNNTSSIRKTSVIEPIERLNPKIFNYVNTSPTTLFIPNQLLRRQGKSLDNLWKKQVNNISFPRALMIHYEFPAREGMLPVSLYWYDGGLRSPKPRELEVDGKDMPEEELMFVGDKGKILTGFSGSNPRIIPESKMQAYKKPPETLPRPIDELDQWIRACKGGQPAGACFENIYPFAQTVCLGAIALRVDKKLKWDAENVRFTNSSEANNLIRRKYRKGWEL